MCVHDAPFLPRPRLTHSRASRVDVFWWLLPLQPPLKFPLLPLYRFALLASRPWRPFAHAMISSASRGLSFTSLSAAVVGFRLEALAGVFVMPTLCHSPPPHCALQRPHRHHAIFRSSGRAGLHFVSLRRSAAQFVFLGAHSFVSPGWPCLLHHVFRMA
jgi:hypothetical protein